MSDTSAGKQQGPTPSLPGEQVYRLALSDLIHRAPPSSDYRFIDERRRARWPAFVQGRAVLNSQHHGAIRAFRSFANDDGPTPVLANVACLSDVAACLYANTDRPVRADIIEAAGKVCAALLPLVVDPIADDERVWFGLLGIASSGEVRLDDYLGAVLDDLATGPAYVRPMLGLQICSLLGSIVRCVRTVAIGPLRDLLAPSRALLAFVASAAVFAGTIGSVAVASGPLSPPPNIVLNDPTGWALRATFHPAFRVALSSAATPARFTASGSSVSALCAVFLADPTGPTCGSPGLCLVYPRSGARGALRGSRGEIPLSADTFASMQRLVQRYYEDQRRVQWAAHIHALYGDI